MQTSKPNKTSTWPDHQHYEHLLNESSTEISELESSIELKYQAISKMQVMMMMMVMMMMIAVNMSDKPQEEMMILQMRKERLSADIDQVVLSKKS